MSRRKDEAVTCVRVCGGEGRGGEKGQLDKINSKSKSESMAVNTKNVPGEDCIQTLHTFPYPRGAALLGSHTPTTFTK